MAGAGALIPAWRPVAGGISVLVKVRPRARRPGVQGIVPSAAGPRLHIGVREAAEDGKANRAVCATLARALGVPSGTVAIAIGGANREKVIHVAGDPETLAARLAAL